MTSGHGSKEEEVRLEKAEERKRDTREMPDRRGRSKKVGHAV